jgi:hypothetical protein
MPGAGSLWPTISHTAEALAFRAWQSNHLSKCDPSHRCPICGADTELVSITFTHRDGEMQQIGVTSPRRRCANLKCKGHEDGLNHYNFDDR